MTELFSSEDDVDSLILVGNVIDVEEEFGVNFPDPELESVADLESLFELLKTKLDDPDDQAILKRFRRAVLGDETDEDPGSAGDRGPRNPIPSGGLPGVRLDLTYFD